MLKKIENFNVINESSLIDYIVIHMKNSDIRKKNIDEQTEILNIKINIFDAIIGKNIKNVNDYDKNIKLNYKFNSPGELGCYLSHLMIIKNAITSKKKYTVIFEDDFTILSKDLNNEILNIIQKVNNNFDIIYLGNNYESKSEQIIDNIYKNNKLIPLLGIHGYLINNKNAKKIYNNLLNIKRPIDWQFNQLINNNKLVCFVIYPSIIIQNNNYKSDLRPQYKILLRNIIQKVGKIFSMITD